jgi:hypothetical protein
MPPARTQSTCPFIHGNVERSRSVLAEVHQVCGLTSHNPLHEVLAAFGAKIEPHLLVYFVGDVVIVRLFQTFQDILYLLEMIPIVVNAVVERVEDSRNINPHDVAKVVLGIEIPFAEIARVTNHQPAPQT